MFAVHQHDEVDLDVRRHNIGPRFDEADSLDAGMGDGPCLGERIAYQRFGNVKGPQFAQQRNRLGALLLDFGRHMIRQILPDALELMHGLDANGAQMIPIANSGKLKKLRRIDRASSEDHLPLRPQHFGSTFTDIFDADSPASLDENPAGQGMGDNLEIGARHRRLEVAIGSARPPSCRRWCCREDQNLPGLKH